LVTISASGDAALKTLTASARQQGEHRAHVMTLDFERCELVGEAHVALAHARGIDENELLVGETVEHAAQIVGILRHVHRRAHDSREVEQLLARTDTIGVRADEPELIDAVPQNEARRDFRDARRLADAGGPHDREDAARIGHVPIDERQPLAEAADEKPHGLLRAQVGRYLIGKFGRERGVDAELCELAQQARTHRRLAIQIVPGEARQLRFEQATQVLELVGHRRIGSDLGDRLGGNGDA
jgi:hypothetical protein